MPRSTGDRAAACSGTVTLTGTGRSQMAAGFLNHLAGDRIEVRSAGSIPGDQVNPAAVEAMKEVGVGDRRRRNQALRIRSPLRILAALADPCSSNTFSQVRSGDQRRRSSVFVSLFLSLWPQLGLNGAWQDRAEDRENDHACPRPGTKPARSGFPFQRGGGPEPSG
jgi:hypothetical protein